MHINALVAIFNVITAVLCGVGVGQCLEKEEYSWAVFWGGFAITNLGLAALNLVS